MAHRLARRELLNALVEGIDDEEIATAVEGERVWGGELAWLGTLAGLQAAEQFAVGVELLNAAVDRRDPNVIVRIDGDADRTFEIGDLVFGNDELAAEATRFIFKISPRQDWLPFARQLLNSAHHPFGRVEMTGFVERQKLRTIFTPCEVLN